MKARSEVQQENNSKLSRLTGFDSKELMAEKMLLPLCKAATGILPRLASPFCKNLQGRSPGFLPYLQSSRIWFDWKMVLTASKTTLPAGSSVLPWLSES